MKKFASKPQKAGFCALLLAPVFAFAFDSGSTGVDGAFHPTVNTELALPPSGIFNFTSVNIPTGVTVRFKKNATNTPVVILASGNVNIAGVLNVSGDSAHDAGAAGDGNLGNDGLPGAGGPGGFGGGQGGKANFGAGGTGLGPGGGTPGVGLYSTYVTGGGGGGFSTSGRNSWCAFLDSNCNQAGKAGMGGEAYGSSLLLPLIGGSGGGGGTGGANFGASGGGGGGGAILIAASGIVTITGSLLANAGWGGESAGSEYGATGGGGSGGAIRIMASTLAGNGIISAEPGKSRGAAISSYSRGGDGAAGRIRLEADRITRTGGTTPDFTTGAPGAVFVAGLPSLAIISVAGVAAPATPSGTADIILPASTANPVTVVFKTTNVPVGNTVKLTLLPASGIAVSAVSPALNGTTAEATASVDIRLPAGPSTLQAQTTYTIVAALGESLRNFAGNERVERIELVAAMDGLSHTHLVTISGKRYKATPAALDLLGSAPASMVVPGS